MAHQVALIQKRTNETLNNKLLTNQDIGKTHNASMFFADAVNCKEADIKKIFEDTFRIFNDPSNNNIVSGGSLIPNTAASFSSLGNKQNTKKLEEMLNTNMNFIQDTIDFLEQVILTKFDDFLSYYSTDILNIIKQEVLAEKVSLSLKPYNPPKKVNITHAVKKGYTSIIRDKHYTEMLIEAKRKVTEDMSKTSIAMLEKIPEYANSNDVKNVVAAYRSIVSSIDGLKHSVAAVHGPGFSFSKQEVLSVQRFFEMIGGYLSNASAGVVGEFAHKKALDQAIAEGNGTYGNLNFTYDLTGSGQSSKAFEVFAKTDPNLKNASAILEELKASKAYSKNDITVMTSSDKVLATFGISVKTITGIDWGKSGNIFTGDTVQLHAESNTTLDAVVSKIEQNSLNMLNKKMVYNILAGKTKATDNIKPSQDPNLLFENVKDLVVKYNLVDSLTGSGSAGDNSIFLMINGKLILMYDVINAIASRPDSVTNKIFTTGKKDIEWERKTFTSKNIYIKDATQSIEKGIKRTKNIRAELRKFKLNTTIDLKKLAYLFNNL